jgi:hypothetical protein
MSKNGMKISLDCPFKIRNELEDEGRTRKRRNETKTERQKGNEI